MLSIEFPPLLLALDNDDDETDTSTDTGSDDEKNSPPLHVEVCAFEITVAEATVINAVLNLTF